MMNRGTNVAIPAIDVEGATTTLMMIDSITAINFGDVALTNAATTANVVDVAVPSMPTIGSITTTIEKQVNSNNTSIDMNNFIVRMYVHPFHFYPKPKITPAHHTKQLPQPPQPPSSHTILSSFASLSHVAWRNYAPGEVGQEQRSKEEEWIALWQHFTDFLEQDKKYLWETIRESRSVLDMVGLICVVIVFSVALGIFYVRSDKTIASLRSLFYGLLVLLSFGMLIFAICTSVMYSGNIESCNDNNNIVSNPHYQDTVTTNQFLLMIADTSTLSSGCLPLVVIIVLWSVVTYVIYQIEMHELSGCYYVFLFVLPFLFSSSYVVYHIGGFLSLFSSCRNRYVHYMNRHDDALKKVYFEMKHHNDALTYFLLHPKIQYDFSYIVVDVYYKNAIGSNHDRDSNGLLIWSPSSNFGVTQRRFGDVGDSRNSLIATWIGKNNIQQQQQVDQYQHNDGDGLTTPLLMTDAVAPS